MSIKWGSTVKETFVAKFCYNSSARCHISREHINNKKISHCMETVQITKSQNISHYLGNLQSDGPSSLLFWRRGEEKNSIYLLPGCNLRLGRSILFVSLVKCDTWRKRENTRAAKTWARSQVITLSASWTPKNSNMLYHKTKDTLYRTELQKCLLQLL